MRQHLAFFGAHPVHQLRNPIASEEAHQIIFEREEELRRSRITLTARASAQLTIDSSRLVSLRSNDVKSADLLDVDHVPFRILDLRRLRDRHAFAEFDVGSAAGHVGRDRHRARLTRARDNLRLALVVLRVQDVVRNSGALEHARQRLRHVDAHRSNKNRITQLVKPLGFLGDRIVLLAPRLVDEILPVVANHVAVRWNYRNIESVDLVELSLFRLGGSGHSGELGVHAEVILNRDRRESLRLALHLHAFLRLDRLMQSLRPAPTRHCATRELVDDQHLTFLHDVVHILFVQRVRAQQLVDDVEALALAAYSTLIAFRAVSFSAGVMSGS